MNDQSLDKLRSKAGVLRRWADEYASKKLYIDEALCRRDLMQVEAEINTRSASRRAA